MKHPLHQSCSIGNHCLGGTNTRTKRILNRKVQAVTWNNDNKVPFQSFISMDNITFILYNIA